MPLRYIKASAIILGSFAIGFFTKQAINHSYVASGKDGEISANRKLELSGNSRDERESKRSNAVSSPQVDNILTHWKDLDKIKSTAERRRAVHDLIASLDVAQMPAFFHELSKITPQIEKYDALSSLFHQWGTKDPKSAIDFLKAQPNKSILSDFMRLVYDSWAATDTPSAVASAQSLPEDFPSKNDIMLSVIQSWVMDDPQAVTKYALNLPMGNLRTETLIYAAGEMAKKDDKAIQSFISSLPENADKAKILSYVARYLAETNPQKAIDLVMDIPAGIHQQEALEITFKNWADTDPQAALAFSKSFDSVFEAKAAETIMQKWISNNPSEAYEYVLQNPNLGNQTKLIDQIGYELARVDPQGAISHANRISDPQLRDRFLANVYSRWLDREPEKVLSKIKGTLSNEAVEYLYNQASSEWAKSDPLSAVKWASSLSESESSRYLPQIIFTWAQADPTNAGRYINDIAPGKNRDEMIEAYSSSTVHTNPDQALKWAQVISDEKIRNQNTQNLYTQWYQENPRGAVNWLNQSNIDQNLKALLLSNSQ